MLRFAISPTKNMDISDLRVAIFNYIVSCQKNEDLAIRIEDANKQKNIEGKDKEILEFLNLFSINHARVVYESDFLKYHQKMAMQLMSKKKAFACFCSDEKLDELKQEAKKENKPFKYDGFCENLSDELVLNTNAPFRVRIKKPESNTKFNDIDSFIILRQDKSPTYNYACAVDDMLMNITTVIRSEEFISNTPKQIYVRELLGYDKQLDYIHIPAIDNTNKDDDNFIKWLIDEGFLPSAIANYLVLLGNETPKEIFTLEEAISWFNIENISKEAVSFDIDKLKSINKKHLEEMDEMRLSKLLGFADWDLGKLAKLFLQEASTLKELHSKIKYIFEPKSTLKGFEDEFVQLKNCLQKAPFFEDLNELENYIKQNTKLKDESLFKPLRYILTGSQSGPKSSDVYPLIKNYIGEIVK
ncbi:MAG: glutamate--tRNA ligase [Campylobacterota bacterium]